MRTRSEIHLRHGNRPGACVGCAGWRQNRGSRKRSEARSPAAASAGVAVDPTEGSRFNAQSFLQTERARNGGILLWGFPRPETSVYFIAPNLGSFLDASRPMTLIPGYWLFCLKRSFR